ncbi:Neurexin [Fasciola gigantica]|uniref:Neurexin n=1 Tax=Fasciola gigantica TaxID=46835 RepID=A0A504YT39_FASGI|nr:Neurexin [Fasciola gigantica]
MYGFAGCVASIQIKQLNQSITAFGNAELSNQTNAGDVRVTTLFSDQYGSKIKWNNVEPGCRQKPNGLQHSLNGNCTPRVCQFGGSCVQQWGATRCDCSLTSLTGTHCTEVSSAIHFSVSQNSVLSFEMNPTQNTTRDQLAFGIQVVQPGPVVLFLIQGQGDSQDYLEVSIVKVETRYILLVRYNMGAGQHTLYEPNVDITDGQYHIVQFIRDGPNGLLRVDLEYERSNLPKGVVLWAAIRSPLSWRIASVVFFRNRFVLRSDKILVFYQGLVYTLGGFLSDCAKNIRVEKQFQPKMEHLKHVRTSSLDSGKEWNADQSKARQTQPNDSGSQSTGGKLGVQEYSGHLDNKHKGSSSTSTAWLKDYDAQLSQSPVRVKLPNTPERNNYADAELGLGPRKQFALNIGLIASVSVGGICVLIVLTCVIYRCMRRDEGSYNVDENLAYTGELNPTMGSRGPKTLTSQKLGTDIELEALRSPDTVGLIPCGDKEGRKPPPMVTFSDSCKETFTRPETLGAQPATSVNTVSSKQELLSSPSIHSTDNGSMKRSRLVKIEQPFDGRVPRSTAKSKHVKCLTDFQEWYV